MDKLIATGIKFDAIITDLPYGTTSCKWDIRIPFDEIWKRVELLRKPRAPVVLFGSEPFSSLLRVSNLKEFKYDWVWNKKLAGNGILAKKQPLKIHELVSVFYKHDYYPIMTKGVMRDKMTSNLKVSEINGGDGVKSVKPTRNDEYYPKSIVEYSMAGYRRGRLHPTQKSTELLEYLVRTYTKEGDKVLDFTMGSGTTNLACVNTDRSSVGIEFNQEYFDIACTRICEAVDGLELKNSE